MEKRRILCIVERSSAYDRQSSGYQRDAISHVHANEDAAERYRLSETAFFRSN